MYLHMCMNHAFMIYTVFVTSSIHECVQWSMHQCTELPNSCHSVICHPLHSTHAMTQTALSLSPTMCRTACMHDRNNEGTHQSVTRDTLASVEKVHGPLTMLGIKTYTHSEILVLLRCMYHSMMLGNKI